MTPALQKRLAAVLIAVGIGFGGGWAAHQPGTHKVVRVHTLPIPVPQPHHRKPWGLQTARQVCRGHGGVTVVSVGVLERADIATCRDDHVERVRVP